YRPVQDQGQNKLSVSVQRPVQPDQIALPPILDLHSIAIRIQIAKDWC
ncbi:9996_t:CDS:1, partial [Cetraspora pellucida]